MSDDSRRKALFLDRDGIINEDTNYPHKPEQILFNDAVFTLCLKAAKKGYLLIVITNQAGVARGLFGEDEVRALHAWMNEEFPGPRDINRAILLLPAPSGCAGCRVSPLVLLPEAQKRHDRAGGEGVRHRCFAVAGRRRQAVGPDRVRWTSKYYR